MLFLQLGLALANDADDWRLYAASQLIDAKGLDGAQRVIDRVSATSPFAPDAEITRANILLERRSDAEAAAAAERALALGGDRWSVVASAGDIYRTAGRARDSIATFSRALSMVESAEDRADVLGYRAYAHRFSGNIPAASADARAAFEIDQSVDTRLLYVSILMDDPDGWRDGIRVARSLFAEQPDSVLRLNALGYALIQHAEGLEEGYRLLWRGFNYGQTDYSVVDSLGWAYYLYGHFEEARALIERATDLTQADPNSEILDHLGDVYWRLNRRDEARTTWRSALEARPDAIRRRSLERKVSRGLTEAAPRRRDLPQVEICRIGRGSGKKRDWHAFRGPCSGCADIGVRERASSRRARATPTPISSSARSPIAVTITKPRPIATSTRSRARRAMPRWWKAPSRRRLRQAMRNERATLRGARGRRRREPCIWCARRTRWRHAASPRRPGKSNAVNAGAADELAAGMMLAWVRTGEGRVDDILIELAPLAGVRPYGGLFAYQQAMALDFAGRAEAALDAYATADRTQLWLPAAVERHADLLARIGRREEAAALLRATESRVSNPALASALVRLEGGGSAAETSLSPAEGAAVGLHGLANIFLQEHDNANGLVVLTLALMLDPTQDAVRLAFADAQSNLGHADAARRALAEIPPSSAYSANARVLDAWVLFREGRRDEALARVQEEASPRGRRALADMYRSMDRWSDAEPIYSALINENARDWRLYFARGAARDRLGRWGEAEADLRRALELSPNQPDVANYLGYSLVDRGERLDEAMALIRTAVELKPTSGAVVDSLGWAYFRLGDYDQAIVYLERAIELEPASVVINDHLGDAYWRADRRIEARFQWQRALALDPMESERAALVGKLEAGLPAQPPARSATR